MQKNLTKCNFCSMFVGNECVAAGANGKVNDYRCKQAIYEYNKWLQNKTKSTKTKYFK